MKKRRVVINGDVYSIAQENFKYLYQDFVFDNIFENLDWWDWLDRVSPDRYRLMLKHVGRFSDKGFARVPVKNRVFLVPKKDYLDLYNYWQGLDHTYEPADEDYITPAERPELSFESWLESELDDRRLIEMDAVKVENGVILTFTRTKAVRVSQEVFEILNKEYTDYRLTTKNMTPCSFNDSFDPDELVEKYGAEKISGFDDEPKKTPEEQPNPMEQPAQANPTEPSVGISLRDLFAAAALVGIAAASVSNPMVDVKKTLKKHSETAYGYADAMLKARKD